MNTMTRYADEIDQAAANADAEIKAIVATFTNRKRAKRSDECVRCGDDIPEVRQIATGGTDHCIDCQSVQERKR